MYGVCPSQGYVQMVNHPKLLRMAAAHHVPTYAKTGDVVGSPPDAQTDGKHTSMDAVLFVVIVAQWDALYLR